MNSCFYSGHVEHIRHSPVRHRFRNRITMAYLDLEEVEELIRRSWLLSSRKLALASFREQDHCQALRSKLPTADCPLPTLVRDYVARITGKRPAGPIRLLTQLRQAGLFFSPLNLFYCYEGPTHQTPAIQTIVAEVSNTPWNQRRLYVLHEGNRTEGESELSSDANLRYAHVKDFHVSPFRKLEESYHWNLSPPGEELQVTIQSVGHDVKPFTASMTMHRAVWSDRHLAWEVVRRPVNSINILAAIHWQALRLWLKRCPFIPHPSKQNLEQARADAPTIPLDPSPPGTG
ncbi:MAG: DUF1365 domain-containing protein [Lacipirellulaceae bacterium]